MHMQLHDALPWLPGAAALIAVFWPRKSRALNTNIAVDIATLFKRIEHLEAELATTRADLAAALIEIERLRAMENRLEEIIQHRDVEVASLKGKLEGYRRRLNDAELRIKSLEEWIRAQGVDPRDIEGSPI